MYTTYVFYGKGSNIYSRTSQILLDASKFNDFLINFREGSIRTFTTISLIEDIFLLTVLHICYSTYTFQLMINKGKDENGKFAAALLLHLQGVCNK